MTAYVSLVCLLVGSLGISIWCSEPAPERWRRAHTLLKEHWPVLFGFWASLVLLELFAEQADAPIAGWARASELSTCALAALPIAVAPARARALVAAIVISLLSLLAYADLLYGREFGSAIPIEMFTRAGDAWEIRRALSAMIQGRHLVFLLVGVAVVVMAVVYRHARFEPFSATRHALGILACAVLALPGLLETRAYARSNEAWTIIVPRAALGTGVWGAHLIDGWRKLGARSGSIGDAEVDQMRRDLVARKRAKTPGTPRQLNVLILQLESLNAWALDVEIDQRPVMPRLRALRDKGLFVRALDQTGNGRSSDADLLALTSQHPLPEAPVSIVYPENRVLGLPGLLAERGYGTWSFSCDSRDIWQGARRHARYGIQHASFRAELGVVHDIDCDRPLFTRVRETLASAPRPFFAWAITLAMHPPYEALPAGRPRIANEALSGSVLGNYLDVAHDTDRALGELWTLLEASGIANETVLVVYGDHVAHEPLAERESLARLLPESARSDPFWTKRVPLVIVAPGLGPEERPPNAGLIDVAPSVLDLLSLDLPRVFLGRSLLVSAPDAIATRWDGGVAGTRAVFCESICTSPTGAPLPLESCSALRAAAEAELSLSFRMTRHDLFRQLSAD